MAKAWMVRLCFTMTLGGLGYSTTINVGLRSPGHIRPKVVTILPAGHQMLPIYSLPS